MTYIYSTRRPVYFSIYSFSAMMDDDSGDDASGMMREMGRQVDEEVNRDKTGEGDGMNL